MLRNHKCDGRTAIGHKVFLLEILVEQKNSKVTYTIYRPIFRNKFFIFICLKVKISKKSPKYEYIDKYAEAKKKKKNEQTNKKGTR